MESIYFLILSVINFAALYSNSEYVRSLHHPVPTFFRRTINGRLIDARLPEFDKDIRKPLIQDVLPEDRHSAVQLWPNPVKNGGLVTVMWKNIKSPSEKDFIAYYCPFDDNPNHYLDIIHVKESLTWKQGYGHYEVQVFNMRSECIFKYYRGKTSSSQLVATSDKLGFEGGATTPLQGHIAMTEQPTEMRIMWNSGEVNTPAQVRYGPTKELEFTEHEVSMWTYSASDMCLSPANTTGFWKPGNIFDVVLKGLEPNTRYFYSYGSEGQMSEIRNFTTPIPAGDPTPYKFIVYGDMGTYGFPQSKTTADLVMEELKKNDIRFIFHHGDISYACGYAYVWEKWFYLIEPYATHIPYMIGVGNHEYDHTTGGEHDPSHAKGPGGFRPIWFNGNDDSGGECGVPMYYRFHMPDTGHSIWWYSYDYGLVHYIMISTEHDFTPGSPMYMWLENDLRNVDRKKTPWVIIAGHRAMYCSASIAGDYIVALNMQRLFEDLLYKYTVDLAFWAHYHSYERTCKLYKNKCTEDGIQHIVVGSAGYGLDPDVWYKKHWSVFHMTDFGYGRVTVANKTHMLYEWVNNRYDRVLDSVWLTK